MRRECGDSVHFTAGQRRRREIRKAFCEEKDFTVEEELVYTQARLLKKEKCTEIIRTDRPGKYYPSQETAEKIVQDDMGKLALTAKEQESA